MKRLKIITCSGVNEHTDIGELLAFASQYENVEFGIQVSGRKCGFASPRYVWLHQLHEQITKNKVIVNLALHVNQDWVVGFCQGDIAPELFELLLMEDAWGNPLFSRVQLNFKIGREEKPNLEVLLANMAKFPVRFILSYNDANADFIQQIWQQGIKFDCLFDASYGEGIVPNTRPAPAFADEKILQGYAGGLSPDNVADELNKIAQAVPEDRGFCIDAEGRLKDENGVVSLINCRRYVENALAWQRKH